MDTGKMALGLPRPREVAVLDLCRRRALDTARTVAGKDCRTQSRSPETLRRNPVLHRKVGELSPMAAGVLLRTLHSRLQIRALHLKPVADCDGSKGMQKAPAVWQDPCTSEEPPTRPEIGR